MTYAQAGAALQSIQGGLESGTIPRIDALRTQCVGLDNDVRIAIDNFPFGRDPEDEANIGEGDIERLQERATTLDTRILPE